MRNQWASHFYPRPPRGGRPIKNVDYDADFNFYPRPPRGGRRSAHCFPLALIEISIHALREEGDGAVHRSDHGQQPISIHALREEGDASSLQEMGLSLEFLSTPSARRATSVSWRPSTRPLHFYPRPPRGGRLIRSASYSISFSFLSTPSARRATRIPICDTITMRISIHALREEGDTQMLRIICTIAAFLSTPSARRATQWAARQTYIL